MKRLAPQTWRWAVLQSVREAARRADAAGRAKAADPDALVSLFRFGFEIDAPAGVGWDLARPCGSRSGPTCKWDYLVQDSPRKSR